MKHKPIPIGVENFEDIITKGYYYVDKTLFIKELIDNKGMVNLFTRPRRFGKSLNISMFQYFFDKLKKDKFHIFEGLNIMSAEEQYLSEMNQYPVIKLTLKSAGGQNDFNTALLKLKEEIRDEFDRHSYLLNSEKVTNEDKELYQLILKRTSETVDYSISLKFLSKCLEKHHDKKVIILIDEYDVPLESSYFNGYYKEMITFIRSLFELALKTNDSLNFAILTGCLRISKESIFTGLNNLNIVSITSNAYGEYFGFTEDEVYDMLSHYNITNKTEEVKEWYNGYLFGETNVYNPWSMIKYIFDIVEGKRKFPGAHWANTSSNNIIRKLITIANDDEKEEIEALIKGETITKPIHEDIVYNEIDQGGDNLWNFLFFTGYLKKTDEKFVGETSYFNLKIPNQEVMYIYKRKIREWFEEKIKATNLSTLYTALLNKDTETCLDEITLLLADSISYLDSHENFYHGFMVGILSQMKGYIIKSNRESGDGRSDIYIMPRSVRKTAIILELKVADKFMELDKKCDDALKQIEEQKYDYDLKQLGYSDILKYGIAFYRKDCMVVCSVDNA